MATYKSIRYIVPAEAVEHTDSINALSDVDTNTTAPTDGQILKWNNTNSKWYPGDVEESASGTQKAIFGFGTSYAAPFFGYTNVTNLVSSSGVVATNITGVGTARDGLAAAGFGGDKAIFGFSYDTNVTNLVSNTGVVASDSTGVGTTRGKLSATGYGGDKAIFGFGDTGDGDTNVTNLVSNAGVVSTDTTGVGTSRGGPAAAGYGSTGQAIFGFGTIAYGSTTPQNVTNLVSNTGVVASDTTGVGTARGYLAAAGFGGDKAIFGFGEYPNSSNGNALQVSITNLVSNTGVVASDTTGVGTARDNLAAAGYGGDKAIFGFGYTGSGTTNVTNLVSNTGVVSSDQTGVGTARNHLAAAGYSTTA